MYQRTSWLAAALALSISALLGSAASVQAQATPAHVEELPLAKDISVPSGQTVTPAFEGWYENPDGTKSIVFGYYSRNNEEVLEVPMGPNNTVEGAPEEAEWSQPTRFEPGRHWGVFAVRVPEDFDGEVVWKLQNRGKTFEIPGGLNPLWETDAIAGDAMGNHPPRIRFQENGPSAQGPAGVRAQPMDARVGEPLGITVWGSDDGVGGGMMAADSEPRPLQIHWLKHSGPGSVTFSPEDAEIPVDGGSATTEAVFSAPGEYMLRVRANDASGVVGGGHAQCCWTNGYVQVNVTDGSTRSAP